MRGGGGGEGGEGGRVRRFKGGERVGEGEGALFLLPWGEGGGRVQEEEGRGIFS